MTLKQIIYESAKKVIKSINPGTKDISGISDGTIKGAVSYINVEMKKAQDEIAKITKTIGTKVISGIGDGTIKGAINYLNEDAKKIKDYTKHTVSIAGSDNSVAYAHQNDATKIVNFTCKVKINSSIAAGTRFAWLPTPQEYTCFNLVGYGETKDDVIDVGITLGTDGVAITRYAIPAGYVVMGACSYVGK